MKWHPGHYAQLNMGDSLGNHLDQIDQIGGIAAIKGVMVRIYWAEIETSKGVYNFWKIDAYLRQLQKQPTPKRLVLRIMDRRFGEGTSGIVPSYLRSEFYHGGLVTTSKGHAARLWEKPVMDRLITLYKVVGQHYDKNLYFEGIATEETTLGLKKPYPSSYSDQALADQWKRLAWSVPPSMPQTNLFVFTNWLGSPSLMGQTVQTIFWAGGGVGGPDVIPNALTDGQKTWTGVYGADYRGKLPIANSVEDAELGGSKGSWTPLQLNNFAYDTLHANYVFWVWNTWQGNAAQRWSTGILPFLRTNPKIRTTCPTSYAWCFK